MKFCSQCGQEIAETAKFCGSCGALNSRTLEAVSAPPPLPQKQAQSSVPASPAAAVPLVQPSSAQAAIPPPPPETGWLVSFRPDPQGQMVTVTDHFAESENGVAVEGDSMPGTTEREHGGSLAQDGFSPLFDIGENVALPPAGPQWGFRDKTTPLAEKLVGGFRKQAASSPVLEALDRVVRGALMDKNTYRSSAANASLMNESLLVAAAIIVVSTVGLRFGSFFGTGASFLIKTMVIRAFSWAGAVLAVQLVAKTYLKTDLPPAVWFRAMVYAQGALVLGFVPPLLTLLPIWVAVCTVAALQDVSGKGTKEGIILLVVAGVASAVVASLVGSFWR